MSSISILHIIIFPNISGAYNTYYVDFACPLGKVITTGNQTPLEKKPGCGETPGPTGIPANNAGG